jgi:hypothetical protein
MEQVALIQEQIKLDVDACYLSTQETKARRIMSLRPAWAT